MSKQTILITLALLSTQVTGCSTIKSYFFKPAEIKTTNTILRYNFIEPRRTELPKSIANKLNQEPDTQNRFIYYSASGYKCRLLSLTTRQSACNIKGQWRSLAPIMNPTPPL